MDGTIAYHVPEEAGGWRAVCDVCGLDVRYRTFQAKLPTPHLPYLMVEHNHLDQPFPPSPQSPPSRFASQPPDTSSPINLPNRGYNPSRRQ